MDSKQKLVQRLINAQLNSKRGDEKNYDIFDCRKTLEPPLDKFAQETYCVYFYYIRIDKNGKVRADHYFYVDGPLSNWKKWKPICIEDLPDLIYKLALNARPRTKYKNPRKMKTNSLEGIEWEYKSYIAIFFDEANWSFYHRKSPKDPSTKAAITVNVSEGGTANHTFFDAKEVELRMPKGSHGKTDKRTAIFFVNHMKANAQGDDLGEVSETFKFDMYFSAKWVNAKARALTVIFDPDGTNLGPPLPPP
jgi:hypothetical protein